MKIGVIYCAWQSSTYVAPSLESWVRARALKPDGNEYVICAVNVPFLGFPVEAEVDDTRMQLHDYMRAREIDHFITEHEPMHETEARGAALTYLVDQGVDTVIQVDSDEFYTLKQIRDIFAYVAREPLIGWFRLSLRNYVFSASTYLAAPFTPPRIHRIRIGALKADRFVGDNDISWGGFPQHKVANLTIPESIAWIRHLTWQDDERSRLKVLYQQTRWGHCSYAWTDGHLQFDPLYYQRQGLPIPETLVDSTPFMDAQSKAS